jgi:endonuclease YncB( thermonuclease family)
MGNLVRPTGYDTPEKGEEGYEEARLKLTELILKRSVDVRNWQTVDKQNRLVADVFLGKKKNLAEYFPEYKV